MLISVRWWQRSRSRDGVSLEVNTWSVTSSSCTVESWWILVRVRGKDFRIHVWYWRLCSMSEESDLYCWSSPCLYCCRCLFRYQYLQFLFLPSLHLIKLRAESWMRHNTGWVWGFPYLAYSNRTSLTCVYICQLLGVVFVWHPVLLCLLSSCALLAQRDTMTGHLKRICEIQDNELRVWYQGTRLSLSIASEIWHASASYLKHTKKESFHKTEKGPQDQEAVKLSLYLEDWWESPNIS